MAQLRDIRADLEARLQELQIDMDEEAERHKSVMEELRRRGHLLRQTLADEERRWRALQPSLFTSAPITSSEPYGAPLTALVCELMADGQEWSLDRLTKAAEERTWNFHGKNARRALHFTLLGLKNRGTAEMPRSGCWRLRVEGSTGDRAWTDRDHPVL